MTDPNLAPNHPDEPIEDFADLPMQPTGSGVADLEIAYEQMRLDEAEGADGADVTPEDDAAETVAHPS